MGSNPSPPAYIMENRIINIGEALGREECPYCYRWVLNLGLFAIRLHHWVGSDDERALHNHPYWFITFVIKGAYEDVTESGSELLKAFTIRFRKASHTHTVRLKTKDCWTLLISGPPIHQWGFFTKNRFWKSASYFDKFGKHQCEER